MKLNLSNYIYLHYQKVKKRTYSEKLDEISVLHLPTRKFIFWILFNIFGDFIYYGLLYITIIYRQNSMVPEILMDVMTIILIYQIITETVFVQFEIFRLIVQRLKREKKS